MSESRAAAAAPTRRPLRAIQQIMLGTVCNTEAQARDTLRRVVAAGFEGIELNGFMTRPTSPLVGVLTRLGGMPAGRGGRLDWASLVGESGLAVVGLHEDLGTIEREPDAVIARAGSFRTTCVVVPGMYRFDYTDPAAVEDLATRLNRAGASLAQAGVTLLYHNHNAELRTLSDGPSGGSDGARRTAYGLLIERTDPAHLGFEVDAYWLTAAGADAISWLRRLGERLVLLHLTDRGTRRTGRSLTPIDKADTVELGSGSMNLPPLIKQARAAGARAVILETHRNWLAGSPVASFERSASYLRRHLAEVPGWPSAAE